MMQLFMQQCTKQALWLFFIFGKWICTQIIIWKLLQAKKRGVCSLFNSPYRSEVNQWWCGGLLVSKLENVDVALEVVQWETGANRKSGNEPFVTSQRAQCQYASYTAIFTFFQREWGEKWMLAALRTASYCELRRREKLAMQTNTQATGWRRATGAHLPTRDSGTWTGPPHSCRESLRSGATPPWCGSVSNTPRAAGCAGSSAPLCAGCCPARPEEPPTAPGSWGRQRDGVTIQDGQEPDKIQEAVPYQNDSRKNIWKHQWRLCN